MGKRREGRGRLSGIERLPPECDEVIAWASAALRDRNETQTKLYEEFRARLEAVKREHRGEIEFTIPSFTAFNRYSLKLATMTRRLEETREIAGAIAERFDAEASDNLTVIAAEAIKTLVFEVLTSAGEAGIDPKGAMQLAAALRSAAQAQGVSTARRNTVEKEFETRVDEALDRVAAEGGVSAEWIETLKRKFLGVRPRQEPGDATAS